MLWLLVVISALLLSLYCIQCDRHRKKYAKFYSLPKAKTFPFIGHGHLFLGKQMFKVVDAILKQVGLPCLLYLPEPYYCTSDPKEIKTLLNHPNVMSKSENYNFFQVVFGNGLIFTPADLWRPKRKLLSRAFNRGLLNSFVPIFYKNSCATKDRLLEHGDLYDLFKKLSLTNFLETAGGASLNNKQILLDEMTRAQEILINRATSPILRYDFVYKWTKEAKFVSSYLAKYRTVFIDKLKEKICNDQNTVDSSAGLLLFDILMALKNEGTHNDEESFQEVSTFLAAGTETTGHTLAFVCTLLGMHPHIQEKVFEEVMTVVGPDKEIEYTDLPNLKYTEMVILETLRMIPTIPIIGRKTEVDIDIGRCVIPSGSNILFFIYNLHNDEKYYPNPTEFDPDRFLPEEVIRRDPNTYIPFAIGSRNCIGWLYALMMMKLTIANIVRDYKISSKHKSVTEFDIESNIVIKIVPNPDCRFTRR